MESQIVFNPIAWIATAVVLLLTTWWFLLLRRRRRKLPPSPPGPGYWPVPWLQFHWSEMPAARCAQWSAKYGDVFGIRLGTKQVVVLSGSEVVRECFVKQESTFSERPDSWPLTRLNKGLALATRNYDKMWKRQRAFTLNVHRNIGVGNNLNLEEIIKSEVTLFANAIGELQGEAFPPDLYLAKAAVNILSAILFGSRYDYGDAKLEELVRSLLDIHALIKKSEALFTYAPLSWHVLLCRRRRLRRSYESLLKSLSVLAEEHKQTPTAGKMRHAFDLYTREVAKQEAGERSIFEEDANPDDSLLHNLAEYFYAGAVSMAKILETVFVQMVDRPEIQKKVRKEIKEVKFLNGHRTPTVEDIENSQFSYATILEVLRLYPLEPLGWPRCTTQPGEINGYAVQQGTIILTNTRAIHRDCRYWADPEEFNPERFIDRSTGKVKVAETHAFIPWSVGPRKCVGETVSRLVIWSFFASVMQRYQLVAPAENRQGTLNGINIFRRSVRPGLKTGKICAISEKCQLGNSHA